MSKVLIGSVRGPAGPAGPAGPVGPAGPNTVPTQEAIAAAVTEDGPAKEALSAAIGTTVATEADDPETPIGGAFASRVSIEGRPLNAADYLRPSRLADEFSGSTSDAINAAIADARSASGNEVHLPPGQVTLDGGLVDKTTGTVPGLVLKGASRGTVLRANFDNDAIITLDGSDPALFQFQRGASITNMKMIQASGRVGVDGIKSISSWWVGLDNVDMEGLSGHGIHIPNRVDISSNPDNWASVGWRVTRTRFAFLDGYGVYAPAGLGFSGSFLLAYFSTCRSGGIYAGGHQIVIDDSSFTSCGETTGRGAVYLDRIGNNTPRGFKLLNAELDGNYGTDVTLVAASAWEVSGNRFASRANSGATGYRAPVLVRLGDSSQYLVAYGSLRNNTIRQDSTANGWASTWLHYGSVSAIANDEFDTRYEQASTALLKRAGSVAPRMQTALRTEEGGILFARFSNSEALPAASATYAGAMRRINGGPGVADRVVMCVKNASDAYAWVDLF